MRLLLLTLLLLSACDTTAPDTRCPAPWLVDACPASERVPI